MKRRTLVKNMGLLPLSGFLTNLMPFSKEIPQNRAPFVDKPLKKDGIYERLGVRPVINGRGTITVIGGCRMLPEVEAAMEAATKDFIPLDELMARVGERLGELTGAESGVITTGACGALMIATTGIVTGGDPDKLWQLPDLKGMKNEVIIPKYSWTAYESAVRGVGVNMITVETPEELEAALGPNTAMVLVLAGPSSMIGPLSTTEIAKRTKPLGVPILVDAAAEGLPVPNPHLTQGADLVAYSGGKYLGGPQCAGVLLGRKDLIHAAWVTSAPHHGFGRGYKVGREEILGMLTAVEMWFQRDHEKENAAWTKQLEHIADELQKIEGVATSIQQPPAEQLSNPSPSLSVQWSMDQIPLHGHEVEEILWNGTPRVAVSGAGSFLPFPPNEAPNISINTSQLKAGEEKIIAERVFQLLSNPPKIKRDVAPPVYDASGEWELFVTFAATTSTQSFALVQNEGQLQGTHYGSYASRKLFGTLHGNRILLRSSYTTDGVRLNFTFQGTLQDANSMEGTVSFSEYGPGSWKATRRY